MKTLRCFTLLMVFVLAVGSVFPVMASPLAKQPVCTVTQINDLDFVKDALNRADVKALQSSLSDLGYQSVEGLSLVSLASCDANKHQATTAVIPFTQDGTTLAAHITIWKANWNSKALDGSIAVVETSPDVVYYYSAKNKVASESKDNWSKKAQLPFDGMQGFQLPMTTDLEINETTDAASPLSQKGSSVQSLATTYCKTVQAAHTGYTVLGFVAYKFWERVYFCYNGVSAVSNVSVSAYVSNMDSQHYYRGVVNQWGYYVGTSYDSMRQGQIDNCILKYGCIGSYYPAVQIIAYKDGSWFYTHWQ